MKLFLTPWLVFSIVTCCEVFGEQIEPVKSGEKSRDDLSHYYGFDKLEVFKLEQRSANMFAGDLNHDGLTDLILVDNSHSRLDLLLQRKQEPMTTKKTEKAVNFLDNGWRFEHRKIPVDKQISSLALGDFNGDGRTDVAYFGLPDRLIVRYQPPSGDWTERIDLRLADVTAAQWTLACGDLNGDGRDDLVVLGMSVTYIVHQQPDGTLATAEELMNTSDKLGLAQIADVDGDGRSDLCYVAQEGQDRVICARLQDSAGKLGPELRFDFKNPRGVSLLNIDGRPGSEILTVDPHTNRVKVFRLKRPAKASHESAERLIQYGFGTQGTDRGRDLAVGDLDGDGLTDVVVTDPDAARMIVFRQRPNQGLDLGSPFPGLVRAEHVRIADFDGDRAAEVIVLSIKERTLGLSRFRGGRLTFPQPLPVQDEPVALELADLDADGRMEIVYICRRRNGRKTEYLLRALSVEKPEVWKPFQFGKQEEVSLALKGTPERLSRLDANGDGRPDFIVFLGLGRAPHLFLTSKQGLPVEVQTRGGVDLAELSVGSMFMGHLDQPVLLVAQRNFGRNLKLKANGQWQVVDQYNANETNAKIDGIATLDLDGQPGNEIVLVDSGINKLRVLRRAGNLYRLYREIDLGKFPYKSAHVADLNGDSRDDLLLFGRGKFAVFYAGRTYPSLDEIAFFESKLDRTFFTDVIGGDLNGDGRPDLVVVDTRSHYVELLNYDRRLGLRHALHFKLFEQKSFSRANIAGSQPRESLIVDVTGDGRADLILLTHDRVLLYPQDDGK